MTDEYHAIVWIDHREAKIFHVTAADSDRNVVSSHAANHHLQHKANTHGSGHQGPDKEFFKRVIEALSRSGAILLTGPAGAKLELKNYIAEHRPDLDKKIAGVEPLDHPSDGELVALGRKFFKAADGLHSPAEPGAK